MVWRRKKLKKTKNSRAFQQLFGNSNFFRKSCIPCLVTCRTAGPVHISWNRISAPVHHRLKTRNKQIKKRNNSTPNPICHFQLKHFNIVDTGHKPSATTTRHCKTFWNWIDRKTMLTFWFQFRKIWPKNLSKTRNWYIEWNEVISEPKLKCVKKEKKKKVQKDAK